jgi:uncharacterized membrane protein
MELFIPIFVLLGIFYLIALPILVFVALARPRELSSRLEKLERDMDALKERERQQPSAPEPQPIVEPTSPQIIPPPIMPAPIWSAPMAPQVASPKINPLAAAKISAPVEPPLPPVFKPQFVSEPVPINFRSSDFKSPEDIAPPPPLSKDPGAEIRLGARWATRLGIGFFVVAVVFFGVYISQHAQPWVRLLEVLALAAGVTGLGCWIERHAREFGRVVFSGGLAIFYFAAYAAYAIAPMQVVNSLGVGVALQYLAVAAIAGVAWWRNRSHIATMSVLLGIISCLFALHHQRIEMTLGAALGLLAAAAWLRAVRGWHWPLAVGYVGAEICYIAAVMLADGYTIENLFSNPWMATPRIISTEAAWPGFTLIFPTAYFVLLIIGDIGAKMRGRAGGDSLRVCIVVVGAVAYGLGSWWGGNVVGGSWDSHNLLAAAIGCLAAGAIYHRRRDAVELYEILYVAAGAWAACYLVNEYTGWVRWLALLMECFVFAARVRRSRSILAWVGLAGVWLFSAWSAFLALDKLHGGDDAFAPARIVFAGWPLISVLLWTWVEKAKRKFQDDERACIICAGIFTAVGAVILGRLAWIEPTISWLFLGLAAVTTAIALGTRTKSAWPTAAAGLLFALWFYDPAYDTSLSTIILSLTAFSVAVLAATWGMQRRATTEARKNYAAAGEVVLFLSLLFTWYQGLSVEAISPGYLPLALTIGALGLAALVWRGPWRWTGDLALIWAMIGLTTAYSQDDNLSNFKSIEWLSLGLALALGWFWGVLARREKSGMQLLHPDRAGLILPGFLFAGWTMLSFPRDGLPDDVALMLAGFAVAFAVVGRAKWLPGGGTAAILLSFAAALRTLTLEIPDLNACWTPALVAVAILFEGWLTVQRFKHFEREVRDIFLCLAAAAALLVFDGTTSKMSGSDYKHLSVLWAAAGAVLFISGVAARQRSYRYAGLAELALCVLRVFLVDITDQLGRIFAFGALAIVLLAIGFSYQKLRPWLVGREEEAPAATPTPPKL